MNDDYYNYEKIRIRTGWNHENGGLYDHEFLILKTKETSFKQLIHCYQGEKYLGAIIVGYDPDYPKQIKILKSSGLNSGNASNGIREIWGYM